MGCTWAVAGFQVVSACAHTLHLWRRQMHSSPHLCWAKQNYDIINSTPEDGWVIFVWDLWINLVAGPNISLLVGSCSSVLFCCTSVPAKGLASRPRGSPPVYTPSYWLDEIEWSPILLHAHCLGSRCWTRPPAAVFHRHAGGSGENFWILCSSHLLRFYLRASAGVRHSQSCGPVTPETFPPPPFCYTSVLSCSSVLRLIGQTSSAR